MLPFMGAGNESGSEAEETDFRVDEDGKVYKKGFKKFPNGDYYEGEFVGTVNNREGQGRMKYRNGNVYVGRFEADFFEGFGLYIWAPYEEGALTIKGKRYEGNWKKGKMHGKGTFWPGNGDIYEGDFENGLYHGEGVLRKKNRDQYSGTWQRGHLYGPACRALYRSGDEYRGHMRASRFDGPAGAYVWARGLGSYEGEWRRGEQHGEGRRTYANGNRYEGHFREGEPHGEGVMTYVNGDQYAGDWARGRYSGHGVLTLAAGDRYEGQFLAGAFYGRGRHRLADGGWYEGDYLAKRPPEFDWDHKVEYPLTNGKRCGKGLRVWSNGNKYEGEWNDDTMNGKGKWTNKDGVRYEGDFRDGHRHGAGQLRCGNRLGRPYRCFLGTRHPGRGYCTYEGGFLRGEFHGRGLYSCMDGRRYEGEWHMGKKHGPGAQVLISDEERGNPERMFMGLRGSLYRPVKYTGDWVEDERHGSGTLEYANGDLLIGPFIRGHCHGKAVYVFGRSFGFKVGVWENGYRVRWETDEEVQERAMQEAQKTNASDGGSQHSSLGVLFNKGEQRERESTRKRRTEEAARRLREKEEEGAWRSGADAAVSVLVESVQDSQNEALSVIDSNN